MQDIESIAPQTAIVLTIRPSSGSTFTTAISTDSTVQQLKEKLSTPELPVSSIRLVYSGRVLKDEDLLSLYSIQEGHTIHMVKSASNRATEQASQTIRPTQANSAGNDSFDEQSLMSTLLDNPMIRDMMANPDVVRRMMMANPQTREVMENNPEVAQMLNDPSFLRQSMDMARNPKLMKQAMRNNDRALSNLEMLPGGFNHLRRMYHSVQEPMEASRSAPDPSTDDLNAQFAARLNADTRPHAGELNTTALPNPWAPPPPRSQASSARPSIFSLMGGMGNGSTGGVTANGMSGPGSPFGGRDSLMTGSSGTQPSSAGLGTQQALQNPFGAMSNQRLGGPFPPPSNFGFPGSGGDGSFSPMGGGNSPEMFQQMMQFQQMMRQMQQQQPPQPSMTQHPFAGPFPAFSHMWRGMPPGMSSLSNSNSSASNLTSTASTDTTTTTAANPITDAATLTTTTNTTTSNTNTTIPTHLPPPEERFQTQLASLRDMGFSDNNRNMRALLASGGDVNSAIEFLLRM